jgi:thymidine kinase
MKKPKYKINTNFQLSDTDNLYHTGSLTVYTGPMFSGKTSHIIKELTILADIYKIRPIMINHLKDNRNKKYKVSSHSSGYHGLSDSIDIIKVNKLSEVDIKNVSVVGIDEAQFFPDLYETVKKWIDKGINVYCAGLDSDFLMNKFGQINELLHIADNFIKLHAICSQCLYEMTINSKPISPSTLPIAPFSARIKHNSQEQIAIGDEKMYIPVCRKHLIENIKDLKK